MYSSFLAFTHLSNGQELCNELHTDDKLLVQLKGLLALFPTH